MARLTKIALRRGTAAAWTSADPTLAAGEPGFETDTGQFKIGDGTTAWTGLGYAGGGTVAALDDVGDVNAPSPTDQYVLTWDNGTGKWIAATPAGGAPTGAAGGDLSGTYPNPSVVNSSHDHDATTAPGDPHTALRAVDFLVGTATSELSGEIAVGASPGGELGGTWASPTVDATHSGSTHAGAAAAETADIRAVDVLVGTATEAFSGEIVVGTSPGGELGGTWASPTVDATHAGSTHIALSASEPGAVSTTSSGTAGSGTAASKDDHSHDLGFDDATADPAAVSTAAADGTATSAARKDHVHAHEAAHINHDTTWAAKGDLIVGTANDTAAVLTVGVNDTIPMADSGEATGIKWVASGTPSTQAFGDAAAVGTADTFTRGDHKHAMPSGTKITALSSLTPTTDDVIAIVDDPAGTPVTKKAALSTLVTLFGSATNPAALGTAAAGTSGNKMSRDDHVHPTTGLVTTTMDWTGGGGDISIADTNYVTLATITTTIAAGTVFIVDLDFLVLNNSGGTKTYTTCLDVNGFLIENVDGTTHGASATNRSRHYVHGSAEVRATNLAYGEINNVWTGPTAANTSGNPSLSQLTGTWNTSTSNLTGSSVVVRVRTKASANTATQTATVLGWRIRQIG